jgi:hypothetical protein
MNESYVQAALMWWCLDVKNHYTVEPNTAMIYRWEADLLSVTKAGFVHEFEVKISKSDYREDFKKVDKHIVLRDRSVAGPNYFWYATFAFDIEPPEYAGWIRILPNPKQLFDCTVMKPAPLLHKNKIEPAKLMKIAHLLAWSLKAMYIERYIRRPMQRVPETAR